VGGVDDTILLLGNSLVVSILAPVGDWDSTNVSFFEADDGLSELVGMAEAT
jgi:hypothetical protein